MIAKPLARRYQLTVDEYRQFNRDGFLLVSGLIGPEEIQELNAHCDDFWSGRLQIPGHDPLPDTATLEEKKKHFLRLHMLHQHFELQERFLLHPGILDVLEAIIGPDVMAMQTMLFMKEPGSFGQGFHQDTYYIPTFPATLCGAWIALEDVDRGNGCMWMSRGSQNEPIYPPKSGYGYGNRSLGDIEYVDAVGSQFNDDDDPENTLRPIAERYRDSEVPIEMKAGDVAFFGGNIFHRSLRNRSETRSRRSLVCHYANARSYTIWGGGNKNQILARGGTHMEYAVPKFGTPCAATHPEESRADASLTFMGMPDGSMEMHETGAEEDHS